MDNRASRVRSYCGQELAPMNRPPPWIKNKTGRFDDEVASDGTAILRLRQSRSDCGSSFFGRECCTWPNSISHPTGSDNAVGLQPKSAYLFHKSREKTHPSVDASSRSPCRSSINCASANRLSRVAYLIPRYCVTPSPNFPRICPSLLVFMVAVIMM